MAVAALQNAAAITIPADRFARRIAVPFENREFRNRLFGFRIDHRAGQIRHFAHREHGLAAARRHAGADVEVIGFEDGERQRPFRR